MIGRIVSALTSRKPEQIEFELPAISDPMPVGTRVRSIVDKVVGVDFLQGYLALEGRVVYDEDYGTGNHDWAMVQFDDDPYALDVNDPPTWAWPREDLEIL